MKHTILQSGAVLVLVVALSGCANEPETELGAEPESDSVIDVETTPETTEVDLTLTGSSKDIPQVDGQSRDLAMTVYKSANCGCCKDWVSYLQHDGFQVTAINTENVDQIKAEHGLSEPTLKSCHTALIEGYVVEGHVPASDIRRLLSEKPNIIGLSAPGMPMMSPGMGSTEPKGYDVLAFQKDGRSRVFASY